MNELFGNTNNASNKYIDQKSSSFQLVEDRLKAKTSIGEKIETTKQTILNKLEELNGNEKQRKQLIPASVINNINQSIKDIEVNLT
jgi:hypothetical protein